MIKNDIRRSTEIKNEDIKLVCVIILFPINIAVIKACKITCKLTYRPSDTNTKNTTINKEVE
jgi:hypothetical protein